MLPGNVENFRFGIAAIYYTVNKVLVFFTFGNVVLSRFAAKNLYKYLRDPSLLLRVTSTKRKQKFGILSLRSSKS